MLGEHDLLAYSGGVTGTQCKEKHMAMTVCSVVLKLLLCNHLSLRQEAGRG